MKMLGFFEFSAMVYCTASEVSGKSTKVVEYASVLATGVVSLVYSCAVLSLFALIRFVNSNLGTSTIC